MTVFLAQAADATADSFHMTFGELVLSVATLSLALVTAALFIVSAKLVKATTMAANAEMAKVATNANDDMRDVATASMVAPTPKPPTYAHRPAVHPVHRRETLRVVKH